MRTLVAVLFALVACKDSGPSNPPEKKTERAPAPEAASVVVTDARKDLVFSYFDPTGKLVDVTAVADVPEASRAQVLVRDLSKSPDELHAADFLYVADLRVSDGSGRYPCGAVSRRVFDKRGAGEAVAQVAEKVAGDGGRLVTLYTASWCGVCRQAKDFLRKRGVAFLERDVEKDAGAEEALARKAAAKGLRPQGVPLIDVAGELMMGFDERALEALLSKEGFLRGD